MNNSGPNNHVLGVTKNNPMVAIAPIVANN